MSLLETRRFHEIGLAEIAEAANLSLGELREAYAGKFAIVAGFSRRIDKTVLDSGPAEGETARDRLFDILMWRFDALTPYKTGLREVARAARRDACLATFLHRNTARSLRWMLAAAGIRKSGAFGSLAREGLEMVQADAFRVWLDDDDADLARTMVALDRGLARGERALRLVDGICSRLCGFSRRDRARRSDMPLTDSVAD
jgi:AcrR family transcriptional regulator